MTFLEFQALFGEHPYFDLAMAAQLTGHKRHTLRVQLHRWSRAGKLVPLRRGMYAFSDPVRRRSVNPAVLSNFLWKPSYLSTTWALGYYGLIPERVVLFTSVTTRAPRTIENAFGTFRYSNVKTAFFFGYEPVVLSGKKVMMASPEKALLDLWHLERGEWDRARMAGMRFQQTDLVDGTRLHDYARRFRSPRLMRAVAQWERTADNSDADEPDGMHTITIAP